MPFPPALSGLRVGSGVDVHPFAAGRPLVLGGIEVPHHQGLRGHSDADVLVHAVCDALLGAAGRGDIGEHFPDSDPRHRGRASLDFLRAVAAMLEEDGYGLLHLDCTLLAERPRLSPFRAQMENAMAAALSVEHNRLSVKATTTEGLGFTGREEGILAHAVCLLGRTATED